MGKEISFAPVSRLEGHGKITLRLDDQGNLVDAHFHVIEFRGFEKFLQGRKLWEAPRITTRACGICPISHHLASAKACDDLLGIEIPKAAKLYRELHHMNQTIHSHALHFFFLAAPDFFFPDDETKRNVLGIVAANPDLAKKAIELRKCGQENNHIMGGKAIHPVTSLPGGISHPLSKEDGQIIRKNVERALELGKVALDVGKLIFKENHDLVMRFADIKTNYLGLVKDGNLELYDGKLRLDNPFEETIEEFEPRDYLNYIGERVEDWSYLKFPFYKPLGWPHGIYRVNSLARLNVCDQISTPLANAALQEYRKTYGRQAHAPLLFHFARLVEIIYAAERALQILDDPELFSKDCRIKVHPKAGRGVGVIEAPRGVLIHDYTTDSNGLITKANLIVSTVHNNPAMDMCVKEAAKQFIKGPDIPEPVMNKLEMAVRAYDPCLSCATHAIGKMPLSVEIYDCSGNLVAEKTK
jgi:coenzyme F420-reducing hydrogenase alpha subunit